MPHANWAMLRSVMRYMVRESRGRAAYNTQRYSTTAVGCDLGCGLNEAVEVLDRQVPRRVEHVRATKWPQTQSLFTWTYQLVLL